MANLYLSLHQTKVKIALTQGPKIPILYTELQLFQTELKSHVQNPQ